MHMCTQLTKTGTCHRLSQNCHFRLAIMTRYITNQMLLNIVLRVKMLKVAAALASMISVG